MYKRRYQNVVSKWEKTRLLMNHELIRAYIPETKLLTPQTLAGMLALYAFVYLKPDCGMKGQGIIRIEQRGGLYQVRMKDREKMFTDLDSLTTYIKRITRFHPYLIQRGISLLTHDRHPIDFRVLVQKPKDHWVYSGVVGKLGQKNSITTNYACGGKAVDFRTILLQTLQPPLERIYEMRRKMREISFLIAEELSKTYPGLRELGIDFAIDTEGKIWLIEVNTTPGHQLFKALPNEKIYRHILHNIRLINADYGHG